MQEKTQQTHLKPTHLPTTHVHKHMGFASLLGALDNVLVLDINLLQYCTSMYCMSMANAFDIQ